MSKKWGRKACSRDSKDEVIPMCARIFAYVKVLHHWFLSRVFQTIWKKKDTVNFIFKKSGSHLDPNIKELALSIINSQKIKLEISLLPY
ncbi:MAG: hypothetical protein JEZ06_21210 [Anaerolineaceae bacterium]|nr:hypothetical protein [Anaerolineaceae bacterium]